MRLTLLYLTVASLILCGAMNVFGQSDTSFDKVRKLFDERRTCGKLSEDLSQILAGLPKEQNETGLVMHQFASVLNHDYILVSGLFLEAGDLFLIYELVTDTDNKEKAKKLINNRLDDFIDSLEIEIKSINGQLALQKHPAIIGIMMHMKDELRRGQELLKSVAIK